MGSPTAVSYSAVEITVVIIIVNTWYCWLLVCGVDEGQFYNVFVLGRGLWHKNWF